MALAPGHWSGAEARPSCSPSCSQPFGTLATMFLPSLDRTDDLQSSGLASKGLSPAELTATWDGRWSPRHLFCSWAGRRGCLEATAASLNPQGQLYPG